MSTIGKSQFRLNETRRNREALGGYEMKIIKYDGVNDIIVEFQDEYKTKVHTTYQCFKKGEVKNPFYKSIYNIGYLGKGKYNTKAHKEIYRIWFNMLDRCYNPYTINKHLSYIDCFIYDEWLCFQNFAKWWEENTYNCNNERMHLDKDILIKNNKIYSPETCLIVPQRINCLFVNRKRDRGDLPIGCTLHKQSNQIRVRCNTLEKEKFLGYFPINKSFQAFTCYKVFKENYIKQIADEYKDLIPIKLYYALYNYKIEIND